MKKIQIFLLIILFLFIIISIANATKVTLTWDPNEGEIDGYKVYQRIEGEIYNYDLPVASTSFGNEKVELDISEDNTYYWVVKAYKDNRYSDNSNEVTAIVDSGNMPFAPTGCIVLKIEP